MIGFPTGREIGAILTALLVITMVVASLLTACVINAFGQEHNHPPEDAAIHDKFYSTWIRPDQPQLGSCCSNKDCYPTEFKRVGKQWHAKRREDGAWIAVPPEKFEHNRVDGTPRDSPDGRNHVCMQPPGEYDFVFCAALGGGT